MCSKNDYWGVCCIGNLSHSPSLPFVLAYDARSGKVLMLSEERRLWCITHELQVLDKMGSLAGGLLPLLPPCPAHICCSSHLLWQPTGRHYPAHGPGGCFQANHKEVGEKSVQLRRNIDRDGLGNARVKPEAAVGTIRASQVMQAEVGSAKASCSLFRILLSMSLRCLLSSWRDRWHCF